MSKLPLSAALQSYVLDLVYLHGRLSANEQTASFAPAVQEQLSVLDTIKSKIESLEREQVKLLARRDHLDDLFDQTVKTVARHAEAQLGGRVTPAFKKMFPEAPSVLTASPVAKEVANGRSLATHLAESGVPELAAFAPQLQTALVALEAAEKAWKDSFGALALLRGERDYEKQGSNRLRDKTLGLLLTLFPGERRRVEQFFRPNNRRPARADERTEADVEEEAAV